MPRNKSLFGVLVVLVLDGIHGVFSIYTLFAYFFQVLLCAGVQKIGQSGPSEKISQFLWGNLYLKVVFFFRY